MNELKRWRGRQRKNGQVVCLEVYNSTVSEKNLIAAINAMNRIHIRRAPLLALDARTILDVRGLYRTAADQRAEERRETERVWQSLPVAERPAFMTCSRPPVTAGTRRSKPQPR